MIDYAKIKPGDRLRIVGMGAPGFAKLGDIVTVTETAPNRCDVIREDGESAYFALTCGAQRLEMVEPAAQFRADDLGRPLTAREKLANIETMLAVED
jgi:hypothetical protein